MRIIKELINFFDIAKYNKKNQILRISAKIRAGGKIFSNKKLS